MAPHRTESSFGGPRAPTYATAFADQYQFLLASQESLADLNRRVAERDVYGLLRRARMLACLPPPPALSRNRMLAALAARHSAGVGRAGWGGGLVVACMALPPSGVPWLR